MKNTKNQAYGALTGGRSRGIRVREDLSVCTILAETPPCQGTQRFRLREKGSLIPKGKTQKEVAMSSFQWGGTEGNSKALTPGWCVEIDKLQKMSTIAFSTRP